MQNGVGELLWQCCAIIWSHVSKSDITSMQGCSNQRNFYSKTHRDWGNSYIVVCFMVWGWTTNWTMNPTNFVDLCTNQIGFVPGKTEPCIWLSYLDSKQLTSRRKLSCFEFLIFSVASWGEGSCSYEPMNVHDLPENFVDIHGQAAVLKLQLANHKVPEICHEQRFVCWFVPIPASQSLAWLPTPHKSWIAITL